MPASDEECEQRIGDYFREQFEGGHLPTVEGLALALGTVRQTLHRWENGEGCSTARRDTIKKAKQTLAQIDGELAATGKI